MYLSNNLAFLTSQNELNNNTITLQDTLVCKFKNKKFIFISDIF